MDSDTNNTIMTTDKKGLLGTILTGNAITIMIVLVIVVVLSLLIWLYIYLKNKNSKEPLLISKPTPMTTNLTFSGDMLPLSVNGYEYSYLCWIFIQDWNTNYGKPKCIFYRSNADVNSFETANPSVWLYPYENKLMVRVSTMDSNTTLDKTIYPTYPVSSTTNQKIINPNLWSNDKQQELFNTNYVCDLGNIPLQKWVQLGIVMWDRTMDIYLNGKLARSCILPGVPLFDKNSLNTLYIGAGNTYNGYVSRFKYFNRAVTPSEVYRHYSNGPLPPNWLWDSLKSKIGINVNISTSGDAII
jgi:hypothetical protein